MQTREQAGVAEVLAALARRSQAVVAADKAYIAGILAPEFKHIHATGKVEPRADYLAAIEPGKSQFTAADPSNVEVSLYDGTAVAAGDIYIERQVDGERVGRTSRFVSVWHKQSSVWQLVFWQMTARQT